MKNKNQKSPDNAQSDRERNDALNNAGDRGDQNKLPGEYPPDEDIMNRMNTQRVGMDVENFSRAIGAENLNIDEPIVSDPNDISDDPLSNDIEDRNDKISMERPIPKDFDTEEDIALTNEKNDSDVTEEDLQALGPKDLSMDMGEDEQLLKNRVWPVDMAGSDLDVPGSEGAGDVEDEAIGPEDEENDFYSLGGDRHEDNLEGK
jgi:hypothetical protein